jgi:hypothetical protein
MQPFIFQVWNTLNTLYVLCNLFFTPHVNNVLLCVCFIFVKQCASLFASLCNFLQSIIHLHAIDMQNQQYAKFVIIFRLSN